MAASPSYVVAIGSSAGGLKPLQELLGHLRLGLDGAIVVAQHLASDRPSSFVSLLTRATQLRVQTATDGQLLEPGVVFVLPPNVDAFFEAGGLRLTLPGPRFGPSPAIDPLFESLAREFGENAVGVILSGTGSDGAIGLRAIGANGGLTLVQTPESALFQAMPAAAIALGKPDLIASPQSIADRLMEWLGEGFQKGESATDFQPFLLTSVVNRLKEATGIDFSEYKDSTMLRQLHRRMAVTGRNTMESYLQQLTSDIAEARALMQNLLVTVTSFFRDPEAFVELKRHLTANSAAFFTSPPFRVWVPACATGEEAYTIAMIISEILGHPAQLSDVLKIFATDLDEQSLAIARKGVYPFLSAKAIPVELRERFILGKGSHFEIHKQIRSCIVFARHNVCEDPPFPDINLISCRNLLIYFSPALQERVIDLLSFSLQPGGLLLLGGAESLGQMAGFRLLHPQHRLYERTRQPRARFRLASVLGPRQSQQERIPALVATERVSMPTQHIQLLDSLMRVFAKPSLVLDENHALIEVIGDVSPFCQLPQGPLLTTAISFLRDELKAEARALFLLARAGRNPVRSARLTLPHLSKVLHLEAVPILVADQNLIVLSFIEDSEAVASVPLPDSSESHSVFTVEIERLEKELLTSQDTLRHSLLNLEQANEELEASTEELQASSEELQSSNEELEASNEELQATNDELAALNQQLRVRGDELERLNNDLENIQRSLNQGMVIVDRDLRIMRFSPLAVRLFGLVSADLGHPLIGIPTTVPIHGLREVLLSVLREGESCTLQAISDDNSYLLQLAPYRNSENQILGAILTMTDISEVVSLRLLAEASLHEFERLTDALDQVVWKRDLITNKFLFISARIEELTGWSPAEVVASADLLDLAIVPSDRPMVLAHREAGKAGWDVTYSLTRRDGLLKKVREVAIHLDHASSDHAVVGTFTDVTAQLNP